MIDWDRLEQINAQLNAFVDFDRGAVGGTGALAGLTVGVKANIAVEGLPWTGGLEAYRERIAERDAEAVALLRRAGATIIGTVNMEEAALGAKTDNPFYGATQNPHRIGYTPGGSSGGSAAAVAAGLCDLALGTDTMGSVRIPASYCGIYGLKPTRGAISQDGLELVDAGLDSIGPLARSLEQLDACLRVLIPDGQAQDIEKISILENLGGVDCTPAVQAVFAQCCEVLDAKTSLSLDHPLTRIRYAGFIRSSRGLNQELADILAERPDKLSDHLKYLLTFGPKRDEGDWQEDEAVMAATGAVLQQAVAGGGAILMPTAPQTAFDHGKDAPANQADFTCLANIAGLPAVTVPAGWDAEGLPIGMQLVGGAGNEAGLLALARRLDRELQAYRRPAIFMEQ